MDKLLKILEENATLTADQLAVMLDEDKQAIKEKINEYEKQGVILGYKTIIDWGKTDREYVSALIEVKLTPQRDHGFDKTAEKILEYPEVQSVYLMSGGYDLAVQIEGKTMKEVAFFVSQKLASIESVISTATHFVLCKYKDKGVVYRAQQPDERGDFIHD